MAGDVEARPAAGLHVQVLGDTAGDVGGPADGPLGVSQGFGEVHDVHTVGARQIGERDHAASSVVGWPYLKASWS